MKVIGYLPSPITYLDEKSIKEPMKKVPLKTDNRTIEQLLKEIEIEHPRITTKLNLFLGESEFEVTMNELLLIDSRQRNGFSNNVLNCLLRLSVLHTETYGEFSTESTVWGELPATTVWG